MSQTLKLVKLINECIYAMFYSSVNEIRKFLNLKTEWLLDFMETLNTKV